MILWTQSARLIEVEVGSALLAWWSLTAADHPTPDCVDLTRTIGSRWWSLGPLILSSLQHQCSLAVVSGWTSHRTSRCSCSSNGRNRPSSCPQRCSPDELGLQTLDVRLVALLLIEHRYGAPLRIVGLFLRIIALVLDLLELLDLLVNLFLHAGL